MQSQPDGDYRFILNYQVHLTKFLILHPFRTKTAEATSYTLVNIFCDEEAPQILQSDNGREGSLGHLARVPHDAWEAMTRTVARICGKGKSRFASNPSMLDEG